MAIEDANSTSQVEDVNVESSSTETEAPENQEPEVDHQEKFAEAIQTAIQPEEAEEASETESEGPEGTEDGESQEGEQEGEASPDEADDEGDDLEKGQRVPYERFHKVIEKRNEYRQQVEQLTSQRDEYKKGYDQHAALQKFMSDHNLGSEDAAQALELAAMYVNDPAKAAEMLAPVVNNLRRFTGAELPEDLQKRVQNGELTAQDAKQLVFQRNQNNFTQRQQQQYLQRQQQQMQMQQMQQARQGMAQAADAEAVRLKNKDPEYAKKEPLIRDRLALLISQHNPQTPEQATQLVNMAYESVTKELGGLIPKPDIKRRPESTQGSGNKSGPKSMLEAIEGALRG